MKTPHPVPVLHRMILATVAVGSFATLGEAQVLNLGFDDGNGSSSVDQYIGASGSGWSSAFNTATNSLVNGTYTVTNTTPVISGDGNYLSGSLAFNGGSAGSAGRTNNNLRRSYNGMSLTAETTYSFDFRIDSLTSFTSNTNDVIAFFNSTSGGATFLEQANTTWGIRLNGNTGSDNLTISYASANNTVTTLGGGASISVGDVYSFTITSNPTTETWSFSIFNVTDNLSVGSVSNTGWFGSTALTNTQGEQLYFYTGLERVIGVNNPSQGGASWSLDNISVVPEPSTAALLALSLGSLVVLRRYRRS